MEDKFIRFKKATGYDWTIKHITIQDIKSKTYRRIHKNPSNYYLEKHFNNELILVLPAHPNSNILKIDIDKRNNIHSMDQIIDKIVSYFGDSVFLEKGVSGGYHLFYNIQEKISDNCKRELEKYFKTVYNYIIEVKKGKEELKLPLSKFYPYFGFYDELDKERMIKAVAVGDDPTVNLHRITDLFENQERIKLPLQFRKYNILGTKLKNNKSIEYQMKNDSIDEVIDNILLKYYSYGNGTRYQTQFKIAKLLIENNFSYTDFVYACERCNQYDSKDMANPLIKEAKLKESWKYGYKIANSNIEMSTIKSKYIKQSFTLVDEEKHKLQFILKAYLRMNKLIKYKKNKERIIDNCIILYQEILGRQHYNNKNDIKYDSKEYSHLNKSVALGKNLLSLIVKELNLKNGPLLKKILISCSLITEKTNNEGYSYSYKNIVHSKHFFLYNLFKLYNNYIKLYKKFINTINLYINNNSLLAINYYYRSLTYVTKIYNDRMTLYDELM